jgi:hypothetical protein
MLTKEQVELKRVYDETQAAFSDACHAPKISEEDYEKVRKQRSDAMQRFHEALGI